MQDSVIGKNIAVFVSGGGSNLQALIDAQKSGAIKSQIRLVISSNENAFGLERARQNNIEAIFCNDEKKILELLEAHQIDWIVLAGYLRVIGEEILIKYANRIINIHPSLLPKYGRKGMYRMNVHRAVFAAGEKTSGATVHFVNQVVDGGEIILQREMDISSCKTPEEIQQSIIVMEHQLIVEAVKRLEEK